MKDITRPTLLLDKSICRANMRRMISRASKYNLQLRPHFKTHQSAEVASWCREEGIRCITVSSVTMARYFFEEGWDDITIAFPINLREWPEVVHLSGKIQLNIILSSPAAVPPLLSQTNASVGVFIKVDVGTHRTGFDPGNPEALFDAMKKIKRHPTLQLQGLLCHTGHTYACRSHQEIHQVHEKARQIIVRLAENARQNFPGLMVSMGDTPACSIADSWEGVHEIRPGNFAFYDLMQVQIGSCTMQDIAVCLACPVVAKHPLRRTIVVYGGGVHLSKDRLDWQGDIIYGLPVLLSENGWNMPDSGSRVIGLSQEHGIIQCSGQLMQQLEIGDLVGILPIHSCMTADLMKKYRLVRSETNIPMMLPNHVG